jgi:hypothetical protein
VFAGAGARRPVHDRHAVKSRSRRSSRRFPGGPEWPAVRTAAGPALSDV